MADFTFKQGEDKKISVSVIKNGAPVDLTTCPNIKAILKVNNTEQKKYSVVGETGYGDLQVDSVNPNQVNIMVERDDSKNFPVGAISIILLPAFTDSDFADGIRVEEYKFNIGRVIPGEG
ncbi:MAG TPA: hypothetical protein PKI46_08500, partial [Bacteroidales bacterium]|nr:hypothetical protein [Bacteroidales bacterium]